MHMVQTIISGFKMLLKSKCSERKKKPPPWQNHLPSQIKLRWKNTFSNCFLFVK